MCYLADVCIHSPEYGLGRCAYVRTKGLPREVCEMYGRLCVHIIVCGGTDKVECRYDATLTRCADNVCLIAQEYSCVTQKADHANAPEYSLHV